MKKWVVLVLMVFGLGMQQAKAQAHGLGIGFIAGDPTGLSLKAWATQNTALDFAVGWSTGGDAIYGHVDYLIHNFNLINIGSGQLPVFYGPGARLAASDDPQIGLRLVGGIVWLLPEVPIDLFLQLAPGLDLLPETDFRLNGALGARYFF